MNVIGWIVFGMIVGVIANLIDPRPSSGGILGAIVLGVIGAVVGGFLGNVLFGIGVTGFNIQSFIVATVGAIGLLFAGRAFRRA